MAVVIRLLGDHEVHLANDFFNRIYQTDRPFKNFQWEFLNGPSGKAIYVVAVDDTDTTQTKIVGIQCAIPIQLISTKSNIVLTAKSEDTLVDPSYRGQKIFERMYDLLFDECRRAGIKYIWGFTPAQKAFERIGFEIPFKTEQALMVFRPFAAYRYLKSLNEQNKLKDRIKIFGLSFLSWVKGMKRFFVPGSELTPVAMDGKSSGIVEFYPQTALYTIHESAAYLKWRLHDNPFGNSYSAFKITEGNKIIGGAIINKRDRVGYIERYFSKDKSQEKRFVKALASQIAQQGSPLARAFCFSYNSVLADQGKVLSGVGFTYLKRGNFFVWKSLDPENVIKPEQLMLNRLFTQGNL